MNNSILKIGILKKFLPYFKKFDDGLFVLIEIKVSFIILSGLKLSYV